MTKIWSKIVHSYAQNYDIDMMMTTLKLSTRPNIAPKRFVGTDLERTQLKQFICVLFITLVLF